MTLFRRLIVLPVVSALLVLAVVSTRTSSTTSTSTAFNIVLFAEAQQQQQEPAKEWISLFPSKIKVTRQGSASSFNPLLLRYRDLDGNTMDSTKAITFTPATSKQLISKFTFPMPPLLNYDNVTVLRFRANVKTPGPETNVFKFQIRNAKTKKWEMLESSIDMTPNQWNFWAQDWILGDGITSSFGDYVNFSGNLILRLISTNDQASVQLDFLKIRFAVEQPQENILSIGDSFTYDLPSAQNSYNTAVVAIDLFDTDATKIAALKNEGRSVICYFSAGTVEDWRPDAGSFPNDAVGLDMGDWEGEKWLDITHIGVRNIMVNRIQLAKDKGCQAVDPDNIDGYLHNTGFNLSVGDTKDYLTFLANEAHNRSLLIGMKNAAEIAGDGTDFVKNHMDFSVVEECYHYDECDQYSIFIALGRPVFAIEYSAFDPDICAVFESMKFSLAFANYALTEFQDCTS